MKLPNFLIVGAAKSGTTSMFEYLGQHPEVFTPGVKEPGFLIDDSQFNHVSNWTEYQKIFSKADSYKVVCESSTTYLYEPSAIKNIKNYLGDDLRILIMLRNPIDMSYSLWKHRRREVSEELDFFTAIESWTKRKESSKFRRNRYINDWNYIGRASYFDQVKRYLDSFVDVKVLIFEEFKSDIPGSFKDVCEFLDVSPDATISFDLKNESFKPKYEGVQKFLTQRNPIKELIKKVIPLKYLVPLKFKFENFNKTKDDSVSLSAEERVELSKYFKEDIKKLSELLERDLSECWPEFKN